MSNEKKYFSKPSAEDGFLNALKLVKSDGGDYHAIKLAARRGNSEKPRTALFSVRVNGVQAKEVLAKIEPRITAELSKEFGDKNRKPIFIAMNISDTEAKSYVNQKSETVNYIDGRCTSIAYVAIGDEVLFQKENNTKTAAKVTEADVTAQAAVVS